ncbi:DNA distortion polypeptide 3 [Escherichia coli]|uniref:DNA distortion polypeptide 3 n=1 Tax=Escherichia coli TaxID=562 RepID=UPI00273E7E80|nr:DNA distortion polypeptide 3 [Escherichia coli]
MGSCAAPSAKGDDKFITTDYLQQCQENYHVFYGVRLIEILFPASEYGTDAFFKEFELINSVILPLVIFDLTQRKPMMIISFDKILDASLLEGTNIVVLECITLADLLTNDNIDFLYKS